ncbi:uncharacterized protein TOL2_C37220 [Desulfobacula toluolica Tol2]|uniref:Uncharacterized protein n=2 Tax=Desulfobacula toluolica TaxID=28223 RepID=K0NBT8_DESTT|nr:uncharacterized protein TOL2_C37220 [Desulfobacula toluolica Tol2]
MSGNKKYIRKHIKKEEWFMGKIAAGTKILCRVNRTLDAEAEVVELRPTKNLERFLFVYKNRAYNQRDQQVIEYQTTMMVTKKE